MCVLLLFFFVIDIAINEYQTFVPSNGKLYYHRNVIVIVSMVMVIVIVKVKVKKTKIR